DGVSRDRQYAEGRGPDRAAHSDASRNPSTRASLWSPRGSAAPRRTGIRGPAGHPPRALRFARDTLATLRTGGRALQLAGVVTSRRGAPVRLSERTACTNPRAGNRGRAYTLRAWMPSPRVTARAIVVSLD